MDKLSKHLLKLAYNHYSETGENEFSFIPPSSEILVTTLNALCFLKDDGYIEVLSDNLYNDSFKIIEYDRLSDDMIFVYCLTSLGRDFARNL